MKIKQADNIAEVLNTMLETKGIVGYKIARNLRMINEELKEYYEIKNALFSKYGEEKDGQLVINKLSNNYIQFTKEIEEVENQEVDFNFKKITDEELENSGLSAREILILSEYFEE